MSREFRHRDRARPKHYAWMLNAGCWRLDVGSLKSEIHHRMSSLLVVLLIVGMLVGNACAQTPLQELFNRVQQRNEATEEQTSESGPFADDRQAAETSNESDNVGHPMMLPTGEALPPPRVEGMVPLAGGNETGDVHLSQRNNGLISLTVRDASLSRVLAMLAQTQHLNIVAANDLDAMISITLRDVPIEQALTAILSVANYTWVRQNNIILVTSMADANNLPADVQGRQIQVFDLDFASANEVATSVTNFLSPLGRVTTSTSDATDNRRTRELVIVEDVPESLARIAEYIRQIDCPPRQVMIEAHVLQVNLEDETRNGVDFHALFRLAGANANILSVPSLAHPLPSPGEAITTPSAPAFLAAVAGTDLQAIIELLQRTTDSKSLGSPKVLVLNGQEAHIQVGDTIYYSQTTTTETSSQQGAASVETGVILRITPRITRDCRVLLRVEPQVSSAQGERPSENLPPDISRIELHSDVMLRDGEGMIIGGLIRETDRTQQQKVPYLGNLRGVGWMFRRTEVTKERAEIIFALIPRILPYDQQYQEFEQGELVKAGVPLYEGPLCRTDRPWDPVLPDGKRVYRPLIPRPGRGYWHSDYGSNREYVISPYPLPQQKFYAPACEPPIPAQVPTQPFLSDEALPAPPTGGQ
jgi:type IV pilus assembly protein PilQ